VTHHPAATPHDPATPAQDASGCRVPHLRFRLGRQVPTPTTLTGEKPHLCHIVPVPPGRPGDCTGQLMLSRACPLARGRAPGGAFTLPVTEPRGSGRHYW